MASSSEDGSRKRLHSGSSVEENGEPSKKKDIERHEDIAVRWACESTRLADGDPIEFARVVKGVVGKGVRKIIALRDGSVKFLCTMESADKLLAVEKYKGKAVKTSLVSFEKIVKGIIHGVPKQWSDELMKKSLRLKEGSGVVDVKRLGREENKTESVIVSFKEEKLPEFVFLGYRAFRVKVFIPRPLRCFKCQRFGHIAARCHAGVRCPSCGGNHGYDECTEGKKTCCNCGESHSAGYRDCQVYKKAGEVARVKVTENLSYSDAVRKVNSSSGGVDIASGVQRPLDGRSSQSLGGGGSGAMGLAEMAAAKGKVVIDVKDLAVSLIQLFVVMLSPAHVEDTVSDRVKLISKVLGETFGLKLDPGELFKMLPLEVKGGKHGEKVQTKKNG